VRGSELYGGGGFDFWGPEAGGEERREQETDEGKRGKEKGEEMFFFWLVMYSTTTFSLSAPCCNARTPTYLYISLFVHKLS
jgi:hypothetical protein